MLILCDSMGYAMVTSGQMLVTKQADLTALATDAVPSAVVEWWAVS